MPNTLYDKIWNDHLVDLQDDGTALLFVDRHLVHEVTSPQAFEGLCEINMFENLTNKFEEIFSSLKKAPSLDENQVDEGLRGIRQALLEADVSLEVTKDFIEKVSNS